MSAKYTATTSFGCDRTYVGRMLRLTSLAPDIIEAILRGNEPDGLSRATSRGLSLEKLRKPALSAAEGNPPVRWDEQKHAYRQPQTVSLPRAIGTRTMY